MAVKKLDVRTRLKALVAAKLVIYGYTKEELAVLLSMSPATFYRKLTNPDTFKVKELRTLFETFNFTKEEKEQLNII